MLLDLRSLYEQAGTTHNVSVTEAASAADVLDATVYNAPPFSYAGPTSAIQRTAGQAQPDLWTYAFVGAQPFGSRRFAATPRIIDVTVAEAGAAADVPSALVDFLASLSEAGSAADTVSNTTDFAPSLSEAAAATDAPSATADFVTAISEAGAATDAVSNATTFAGSISEPASANDASSCSADFGPSCSEAGAASDTVGNTTDFVASVSEGGNATDTPSATADVLAAVSEAANAVDTVTADAPPSDTELPLSRPIIAAPGGLLSTPP